jgi:hypothetical protein
LVRVILTALLVTTHDSGELARLEIFFKEHPVL